MQCVENCDDPKRQVLYEQPVWQTLQMFLGEMLCFLPVAIAWLRTKHQSAPIQLPDSENLPLKRAAQQLRGWKILLLWLPAACDLTGTTLMDIGLLYTPVSIYQMTRGALVLFVGVLSVVFLRRRLWLYQWVSLITVMAGVALVGLSGSLIKDTLTESPLGNILALRARGNDALESVDEPEATTVLVGVFFILFAQIFTASQFVLEEKIMSRYAVAPLVAVGFEGLFGFITILLFIPILSVPSVAARSPFFDLTRGWHQTIGNPTVLWSGVVIAISIALFNYFGLSVTRHVSATARSLTDTCRTLAIWIVSLGLGWEMLLFPISLLQVLGFTLLVYGTFLFNNLVTPPPCLPMPAVADSVPPPSGNPEEGEGLLASLDETAALPADLGQSGYDVVPESQLADLKNNAAAVRRDG